jgi:3-phosphoshikimate 1-carboxyvinyltransferase
VITSSNSQTNLIGLQNLAIKESNRLQAITSELTKLGLDITSTENALLINFNPSSSTIQRQPSHIATYGDHRMAMAFAPLALVYDEIVIENPDVVEKSYPHFWDDLKTVGFEVEFFN